MQQLPYLDSTWVVTEEVSPPETLHTMMIEIKLAICLDSQIALLSIQSIFGVVAQ